MEYWFILRNSFRDIEERREEIIFTSASILREPGVHSSPPLSLQITGSSRGIPARNLITLRPYRYGDRPSPKYLLFIYLGKTFTYPQGQG